MIGNNVRDDLAGVCRILAHHQMIDLWGHLSLRIPRSALVLTTPRFSKHCLPRGITGRDLLVCDASGNLVEGNGDLPFQFEADLEIYRENAGREACIFASPRVAMAAAIAGFDLKPLTHMESETGYGVSTWDCDALVDSAARGRELARCAARATAVHQPGIGVWAAGSDILDCLTTLYHLEYLAQVNVVVANERSVQTIPREDSAKLWRQFSGHHHYEEFFASLDPGPQPHPYEEFRAAYGGTVQVVSELKTAMAFSCRALWARDTLVAFLEHISHRVPGENRFLMTASKNFRDMEPDDVSLLDYDANWIDGPRPPGFKWFHAQLLRERLDVQAAVHTHDVYGRAYAFGSRELVPSYRIGVDIAIRRLPIYGRCDLIVDPEVRRATLDALGTEPLVHEAGHGTDFVAATLERATVDAIQREAFLAMDHLARQFGTPKRMADEVVAQLAEREPSAEDWWWFYGGEVGAPRRSVAGL